MNIGELGCLELKMYAWAYENDFPIDGKMISKEEYEEIMVEMKRRNMK